jgi:hypothetical protein
LKSIGELSVVVGAQVDEFKRGMAEVSAGIEKANKQIKAADRDWKKSFGAITKEVRNLGLAMGTAGAAIVGGLFKAAESYGKLGEELLNLKEKTGIGVEGLSQLKYMAELSGATLADVEVAAKGMNNAIEALATGDEALAKKIDAARVKGEAQIAQMKKARATTEDVAQAQKDLADSLDEMGGETVAAGRAFAALGFNLKTLQAMKPEERFWKLSEALAGIADEGKRSALAVDIFGRSGTNLIPMLAGGTASIQAMKDEARRLGVVLSEEQAQKAAAFDDSMDKVKAAAEGLKNALGEAVIPALSEFVTKLTGVVSGISAWVKDNPKLVDALLKIGGVLAVGGALLVGLATAASLFLKLNEAWLVAKALLPGLTVILGTSSTMGLAGALGLVGLALAGIAGWAIAIKSIVDNFDDWMQLLQQAPWKTLANLISKGTLLDYGGATLAPGTKEKAAGVTPRNTITPEPAPSPVPTAPADTVGQSLEDWLRQTAGDAEARRILKEQGLIPSFKLGGIVPGPIGAPVPVMAHGGEAFAGVGKTFGDTIINISLGLLPGDEVTMGRFISMIKSKLGRDSRRNSFGPVNQGYFFGRSST